MGSVVRHTRKFREIDYFSQPDNKYYLLPFKFHRLPDNREILVNETGDNIIVPSGTTEKIIQRKLDHESDAELISDLFAGFFISEERIPRLIDIIATRYRTRKSFLDDFTSLHIFVISLRCDHTCHYCQVSRASPDKDAFDMKRSFIDKGIAIMMQSPAPHVTMEFQGGEALLAFENIIYAVEKAKKEALLHNKKITYVICTNLAPVDESMLAYIKENHILVSTSLDGPDYIHNENRYRPGKNSYELAIAGISKCREVLGEHSVSALLTTTNLSLNYPEAIVDEYVTRHFHSIFLRPISPFGFATKNHHKNQYDTIKFLEFYKAALNRVIHHNLNGYFIREEYATILLKKILTPFPVGYVDLQSPAGMINSVIVFNYNGNVYATDESRMLAEMQDETFLLGSLETHSYEDIFYGEKAMYLSEVWANEALAGCADCAFQSFCGSDPVLNHATQGDLYGHRPTSSFCKRNMSIIEHLYLLLEDHQINNIFKSWISMGT